MNDRRIEQIFTMLGGVAESIPKIANAQIASAIIVKNDIISIGIAEKKTHPLQNRFKKCEEAIYLHSEIDAIRKALRLVSVNDLKKSMMMIARVKKIGIRPPYLLGWGLAKPCSGCRQAIEAFQIQKVLYTVDGFKLKWDVLE